MPRTGSRPHLVWGWRGTLADDVQRQVNAVNAALATLGAKPVNLDTVRCHFATSAPALCARLLQRPLSERERKQVSVAFEMSYSRQPPVQLVPGAHDLLARLHRSGCSHSVLSLSAHSRLTERISELGIAPLFLQIDGRTRPSIRTKKQLLAKHLATLRQDIEDTPVVLIGDAVDDIRAAFTNQIHAIPYVGGLTDPGILRRHGVPVGESLAESAALAVAHAHTL